MKSPQIKAVSTQLISANFICICKSIVTAYKYMYIYNKEAVDNIRKQQSCGLFQCFKLHKM